MDMTESAGVNPRQHSQDTSVVSTSDLRALAATQTKMRESADISAIAPAMVAAIGAIENPPQNRSVKVRTQAGEYSFRYATLDKILDTIRKPLADNGLCLMQPIIATDRGPAVLTRVLHKSAQWMESETLLPPLGSDPQKFGSAVTYVRRYSISAMLNISSQEDDDANRAAGNHYEDTPQGRKSKPRPPRADEPAELGDLVGDAVARALVNRASLANGVEEGHSLLEAWQTHGPVLEQLRGTKAWNVLERELGAGLKRSLGVEPAAAFVAALRASEPAHVAALQSSWEGKWAETLRAMQQDAPATYALLRRHVASQIVRIRAMKGSEEPPKEDGSETRQDDGPAGK